MAKKSGSKKAPKPVQAIEPADFDSSEDEFGGFESTDEEIVSGTAAAEAADFPSSDEEDVDNTGKAAKADSKPAAAAVDTAEKNKDRAVVYVGRIPHGFYEKEMREYFGQFGTIKNLRLSRNKRTGASKHFAFLEFESSKVADIVCDTMDNYLIFGHILKVKRAQPSEIHENLFVGANRRFTPIAWGERGARKYNAKHSREWWKEHAEKDAVRRQERAQRLKDLGIVYKFK